MLQVMATIAGTAPFFLSAAARSSDPVEKMKLVMAFSIGYIYPTHIFEKPVIFILFIHNLLVKSDFR
jgi:hypothetical protein